MLFWYAGVSFVVVWAVFRSPALDYRLVMLGAVLPLVEGPLGGPWVLHTLAGAVGTLAAVMLATGHRRLLRRQLIGLPIGLMLHLALDGTFTRAELFWWPVLGGEALGSGGLPGLDRSVLAWVLLEIVGIASAVWAWHRFGLGDPGRRRDFLRTGQLDRRLTGEGAVRGC